MLTIILGMIIGIVITLTVVYGIMRFIDFSDNEIESFGLAEPSDFYMTTEDNKTMRLKSMSEIEEIIRNDISSAKMEDILLCDG